MSRTPLVSVILPCHNAASTITDALFSILDQSFSDLEIIAIDDGSADATPKLMADLASGDRRLEVSTAPHRGLVATLREAAHRARGLYIARMDADDISLPQRIERQVELMEAEPDVAIGATRIEYIPRARVGRGALRYERWINGVTTGAEIERDIFVECPLPHPTIVMRREVYRSLGGYRDAGWPEDYDLVLRAWSAGLTLAKVPEVLLRWREHETRLSRVSRRYSPAAFRRCKVHFLQHRLENRPVVVWGAGPVGKQFARELQRQGHELAAFVDLDPRKIGQQIHGAPVVDCAAAGDFPGTFALAAVGSAAGRAQIRKAWKDAGMREPQDCCAVA